MSYAAYDPKTRTYMEHGRYQNWTHDLRGARTFSRKCDVRNACGYAEPVEVVVITAETHRKLVDDSFRLEGLDK